MSDKLNIKTKHIVFGQFHYFQSLVKLSHAIQNLSK